MKRNTRFEDKESHVAVRVRRKETEVHLAFLMNEKSSFFLVIVSGESPSQILFFSLLKFDLH